jgi:hypothetical protein
MYFLEKLEKRETGIKHPVSFEKKSLSKKLIIGVTTQSNDDDFEKVKVLVAVLYDLLKIYGYGSKAFLSKHEQILKGYSVLHNKITKRDKERLIERIMLFVRKAGFGSWKDFFKYKINAFFSDVMDQEVPPMPKGLEEFSDLADPGFLYYGRAKKYLNMLKVDKERIESFAQSVAQSKKGAPPVHESVVREAELKCFEHLTTARVNLPDSEIEHEGFIYPINQPVVEFQLRRTIREIFYKKELLHSDLVKPMVMSTSSHYNNGRMGMGAVGAFKSNVAINEAFWREHLKDDQPLVSETLGRVELSGRQSELFGHSGKEEQEEIDDLPENERVKDTIGLHFDGSKLCRIWKDNIYPELLEEAILEDPDTLVIGLPEPLKVRCITAGPPLTQTALHPLQKWLWRNLKKNSVFALIGETVTEEIVTKQLGALEENFEFISGDYKASTDNLHSWVSECLLDELMIVLEENSKSSNKNENDKIPTEWWPKLRELCKRALTGHFLLHPDMMENYRRHDKELPPRDEMLASGMLKKQQEGQLMGSIISFPFLCMANAAFCRYALEIASNLTKNFKLVDREIIDHEIAPLLINGDDCVFKGLIKILYKIWLEIASYGGLESSVGKTFCSREFLTINSCQYQYLTSQFEWGQFFVYKELKYVNMALVYACKKDGIRGKDFYQMGSLSQDLKRTCPEELFPLAAKLQLKLAKQPRYEVITERQYRSSCREDDRNGDQKGRLVPKYIDGLLCVRELHCSSLTNARVPWFLPQWLGGLGIVPFKKEHISQFDMLGGVVIRDEFFDDLQMRPKAISAIPEWHMHSIVNEMLEDYRFLDNQNYEKVESYGKERNLADEYTELYNLKLVESVLTSVCLPPSKYALGATSSDAPFGILQELDGKQLPYIKRKNFLFDPEKASVVYQRAKSMTAIKHNRRCWREVRKFLLKKSNFSSHFHKLLEFDVDDFSPEKKVKPMSCFNIVNQPQLLKLEPIVDGDLQVTVCGDDLLII